MGRRKELTSEEKTIIIKRLGDGKSTLEIAKMIGRDNRTVKKYVADSKAARKRSGKGKMKVVSKRKLSLIKRVLNKNPLANSKKIFDDAGAGNVSRSTRCRVLRHLGKCVKPDIRPPLKSSHKVKRVEWAQTYMKVNFQLVLFTDECRATLDGPDGWSKGSVGNDKHRPLRLRRQQGCGGAMFWAGIIGSELVGLW